MTRKTGRAPLTRSQMMARVRARDTKPEMIVRRTAHGMGYRYHLHRRDLPGTPDLVFGPLRKVVFVDGCFWHGHHCARGARTARTNGDYWGPKLAANRDRDARQAAALAAAGAGAAFGDRLTAWRHRRCVRRRYRFVPSHRSPK